MLRWTVQGQEPQARADDLEGLGSEAAMFVVLVGLRFGVAPFLWRSEDRAPADVLLLPLLRVRGMPLPSAGKLRELFYQP